ncbi:MAG: hypothetical protein U0X89_01515 [Bacteroidia bacterium]
MTTGNSNHFEVIRKYFKNGCLNQYDTLLSLLHYRIPYLKNAGIILKLYQSSKIAVTTNSKNIQINNYQANYQHAIAMKNYLDKKINKYVTGVFLHGSLGTNELVQYSDFDALIILNQSTFDSKKSIINVATTLKKSERIMQKMDPLQHHGWFVLTEKELDDFPTSYFPPSLFEQAKCLMGKNKFQIHFQNPSNVTKLQLFKSFCNHLLSNINRIEQNLNYYEVKSLLSGFMLLPSVYLQLNSLEGVFKKESFNLLKGTLCQEEYEIMNQVSEIRANWDYQPPMLYKIILSLNSSAINNFFKKTNSGKIPTSLRSILLDMRPAMTNFIQTLLTKAKHEVQID